MKPKRPRPGTGLDYKAVRALDDLQAFDKFQEQVLPKLRDWLEQGYSAEDIYKAAAPYVAAAGVTKALKDFDMTAIKDVLDRDQGKAKERVDHTHRLEKAPEEQLDALILSKLAEANTDEDTQH